MKLRIERGKQLSLSFFERIQVEVILVVGLVGFENGCEKPILE